MESLPSLLERASTQAVLFEWLFWVIVCVTGGTSLLVFGALAYFCTAFRRGATTGSTPRILGSHRLELFWTVTPLLIFLVFFVWGAFVYDNVIPTNAPKDAMQVEIIGKQWMWKAQYFPGGQRVIVGANEGEVPPEQITGLVLPVDRPVRVRFISEDVIHDFGIPAFRHKIDVLPGRYVETWYHPTRVGVYHVFCDQYCGTWHSKMKGLIKVVRQDEFERFLRDVPDGSPAWKGQQVFRQLQCLDCHTNRTDARAPVLEGLYGTDVTLKDGTKITADENYIRESIINPQAKIVQGWGRAPDGGSIMPYYRLGSATDPGRGTISA
ncbi:MAG TPA: cytochrome c oxidase subunit II, partial [Gemmataceae bacterium]|nr:cytochrome c oxidase subunit II [Gemmataceae bacterium]